MNILHVVPSFVPCLSAGGVVNASYQLAKKQVAMGNNVSVFTTDGCKERLNFENRYDVDVEGIHTYYFRNISNKLKNSQLIDTPIGFPRKIKNEIKNFDIIHIHEHRHFLAIITHHYAKKYNIPYVIQSHGSVLPFFQKESIKKIFDRLWGFNILHDTSNAFALTEVEKNQYLKMGVPENKINIVPLGIDLKEYSNLPSKGNFRKKYNISQNSKILLFLGRIHKIKGLDLLIKSFKLLINNSEKNIENTPNKINNANANNNNNHNNDIKLVIVGPDDGDLDNINNLIATYDLKDNIIIPGPLFGNDKKEALVDCDILIMPSQYESFTTSGLEAMACSKPVILTENNHIHNWVNGNSGLVSSYDENDLSMTINQLLTNEDLMKNFGNNARKIIEDKYNWDSIGKQINTIYKNIL